MRIIIACGGTGGHFYPGYVLGKELRARGHVVLFILRRDDPAGPRLDAEDLPYVELDLRGMPRKPSIQFLGFAWKLACSLSTARNLVRTWKPDAAAGMGGYLTFPLAAAARLAGIPFLLHESNSVLGLANRVLRRWASALALGLPLKDPSSSGRTPTLLTGTPVRPQLWKPPEPSAARSALGLDNRRATLLVFGGSQGARSINRAVPLALALLEPAARPQILHLSGPNEEADAKAAYAAAKVEAHVRAFESRMELAYGAADLVLCRSGASTLAELSALAKPAILVPYPFAADNHQEANARIFERAGAARLLPERDITPERLAATLRALLSLDGGELARMSRAYAGLGLPSPEGCAARLADSIESIC